MANELMRALFFWTGATMWTMAAAYILARLVIPLAQVTSYFAVAIAASVRHERWRAIKWQHMPLAYLSAWLEWARDGAPTKVSGPFMTWQGITNWKIEPRSPAANIERENQ